MSLFKRTKFFALLLLASSPAFAYIDPGTGVSFVSSLGTFLVAILAMVLSSVAIFWKRCVALVKDLVARFKKKG